MDSKDEFSTRKAIVGFVIELVIYGSFITIYFLVVLRFLQIPLTNMYEADLLRYAFLSLALIIAQAVLLDVVVTFLLDLLGLGRLK
jgi:hypothetical protein